METTETTKPTTKATKEEEWPGGQWSVEHADEDASDSDEADEITVGNASNSTWGRQTIIQIEDFETFCSNTDATSAFAFRRDNSLVRRRHLFQRIEATFPDRVPIIIALDPHTAKQDKQGSLKLTKERFLCPSDMTAGAFMADLRRYVYSKSNKTEASMSSLFLITERGTMVGGTKTIGDVWERERNQQDFFLYVFLQQEAVFGSDKNSQSILVL